ncbi:hypothetical protein EK21DRAFT_106885 [Setomelanomma holmii]|uniref:Uncharacterized protein n=1 Tax=Setomelanomma holmii TaxID=210430 RepID=A0A9P4HKT1_9PLEO|nr:hypothetical protein EK21DRAFT_106885 [Setomelanomma holmii]
MADGNTIKMFGSTVPAQASVVQFKITEKETTKTYHITEKETTKTYHITEALLEQRALGFVNCADCAERLHSADRTIELNNVTMHTIDCSHVPMIELYMFGLTYNNVRLCEDVVCHLAIYVREHLSLIQKSETNRSRFRRWTANSDFVLEEVKYVYTRASNSITLRQFFADIFCAADVHNIPSFLRYPKQFLIDVMVRRSALAGHKQVVEESVERMEEYVLYSEKKGAKRKRQT